MIYETTALGKARLTVYARDNNPEIDPARRYPAVLVLPGSGYCMCSDRETESVALPFLAAGCTAAVLCYSVAPTRYPAQLHEAAASMAYLREHAGEITSTPRAFSCAGSRRADTWRRCWVACGTKPRRATWIRRFWFAPVKRSTAEALGLAVFATTENS